MTKRYFYTDPLAAAWMAEHHDIKLTIVDSELIHTDGDGVIETYYEDCYSGRYYIRADSLAILEPKDGDVLRGKCGGELYNVERIPTFSGDISIEDARNILNTLPFQIILRNGKAFFTPEVEEV